MPCQTTSCVRAPGGPSCTSILNHPPSATRSACHEIYVRTSKATPEDSVVWIKKDLASGSLRLLLVWSSSTPADPSRVEGSNRNAGVGTHLAPNADAVSVSFVEYALEVRDTVRAVDEAVWRCDVSNCFGLVQRKMQQPLFDQATATHCGRRGACP